MATWKIGHPLSSERSVTVYEVGGDRTGSVRVRHVNGRPETYGGVYKYGENADGSPREDVIDRWAKIVS